MHCSDPLSLIPLNTSNLTKMKEKSTFNQMVTRKAANMHRLIQVMHRVAQKSCTRAFQLFCCPLDTLLCEKVTCCPAQNHQPPEDKTAQVELRNPPSTILIVNISNSTLIDCVIGNDTYPSVVAESQPLMQGSEPQTHDEERCSCSHGQTAPPPAPFPSAEPLNIMIHGSHLNCVIIGDNNYMHADQTHWTDADGPQE